MIDEREERPYLNEPTKRNYPQKILTNKVSLMIGKILTAQIGLVLCYINHCRLFNVKSGLYVYIIYI